jgi:hypothetical protein
LSHRNWLDFQKASPGTWRMVHTIAKRMGITFEEASAIADDCVRREWADHRQHTVRLLEEGRQVAAGVRKSIVSKRQPAKLPKAARKGRGRSLTK